MYFCSLYSKVLKSRTDSENRSAELVRRTHCFTDYAVRDVGNNMQSFAVNNTLKCSLSFSLGYTRVLQW